MTARDWDAAFDVRAYLPDLGSPSDKWRVEAASYRETAEATYDITYGGGARQTYDLFHPAGRPEGLLVFVHGGYWMRCEKSMFSHLAAGGVAADFAVAIVSYTLTPAARISGITREIAAAVTHAAGQVPGPIHIAGHSAGGHLAARMVCVGTLPGDVAARIARVVPISAVSDLRPLLWTEMNETLQLDPAEANTESPILCEPIHGPRITAWVGAHERPEFLAMTRALEEVWAAKGAVIDAVYEPGLHHFTVLEGLRHPYTTLCQSLLS
ncbi:MAG: alpha/beta hydrolase [Pseudomonadota bacterium]